MAQKADFFLNDRISFEVGSNRQKRDFYSISG
jgi:hypothetical protein